MKKQILVITLIALLFSCKDDPVSPPVNNLPDSTTHNIVWEVDTLGAFMNQAFDSYISDENNIWVVGQFYKLDTLYGSNIAHWNGVKWKYKNILVGEPFSLFGLSSTNIWSAGAWWKSTYDPRALIMHFNGSEWIVSKLEFQGLNAIWGTSSSNLYAVGIYGTIIHFDGNTWSEMRSGTDLHLMDIYGTSNNDIYAVGGRDDTGMGVLLHYDGISWKKIYERSYERGIPSGFTSTIWGIDKEKYYLSSGSGYYMGTDTNWTPVYPPADNTYIEKIRGDSSQNIFYVGHFGLVIHWNGKSWKRYEEFYKKPAGDQLYGVSVKGKNVVITGISDRTSKGIVYRGRMID